MKQSLVTLGDLEAVLVEPTEGTSPQVLVVLCHGFGAPGTDLVGLAHEWLRMEPELAQAVFAFPMAPIQMDPIYDSRAWWMIDIQRIQMLMATGQTREMENESPAELPQRRQELTAAVKQLQDRYGLDWEHTILGGFSQGAMLTTDVALHVGHPLAGLLIWSGALINQQEWRPAAAKAEPLRVVQSHGRQDPILPFAAGEQLSQLLQESGHEVEFLPFDGPHTIPQAAITAGAQLIRKAASGAGSIETGGKSD